MNAGRFYKEGEPLKVEEMGVPELGINEALIEVRACQAVAQIMLANTT